MAEGAEEVHQGRDSGVVVRGAATLTPSTQARKMVFAGIKKEKERGELIVCSRRLRRGRACTGRCAGRRVA